MASIRGNGEMSAFYPIVIVMVKAGGRKCYAGTRSIPWGVVMALAERS